jgi:hypothetical protein
MRDQAGALKPVCERDVRARLAQGWRPINWAPEVLARYAHVSDENIAPPPSRPGYAPDPLLGGGDPALRTGAGGSAGSTALTLLLAIGAAVLIGRAAARGGPRVRWTAGSA